MLKNSLGLLAFSALLSAGVASMPATPLPEATAIKLDGAFTEAIWEHVPAVSDFRQRDPKDGGPPTFKTDVKVAYDASNLYVAVRAHDPEPRSPRRPAHPPRHRLPVRLAESDRRLVPRPPHRVRVRRQPGRREGRPRLVRTTATTTAAGTRCGTSPSRATRTAGARSSGFRSRSCASTPRTTPRSASPSSAKSAGSTRPTPGRSSRRARPASSPTFGDLTGLELSQTPKRLELVPYVVGQVNTQPVEPGNPLVSPRNQKVTVGADLEVRAAAGRDAHGDGES